jgi:hypothetical protein
VCAESNDLLHHHKHQPHIHHEQPLLAKWTPEPLITVSGKQIQDTVQLSDSLEIEVRRLTSSGESVQRFTVSGEASPAAIF